MNETAAQRRNKLVLKVSPYNSSNECAECGHTAPVNRASQAAFVCRKYGHADNADHNAARVLKSRGIKLLTAGKVVFKTKKTVRLRGKYKKSTVGPVRNEPGGTSHPTPVENTSAVVGGYATNNAMFLEAGNRHLGNMLGGR